MMGSILQDDSVMQQFLQVTGIFFSYKSVTPAPNEWQYVVRLAVVSFSVCAFEASFN